MAIATNGGHASRAIDFYNARGKYFIIGGTTPWEDESAPPSPELTDFRLTNIVGLKRVDNANLVVPDESGTIRYRSQNWRIVTEKIETTVSNAGVSVGSTVVPLTSLNGVVVGSKLRVNNVYEGRVISISGLLVTLDTAAPVAIRAGSSVIGGALVEGAKYVYVDCYLDYDEFPIVTYRQIGLCTGVTPNDANILKSAAYSASGADEFATTGILEILDNRVPSTRDTSQRELISLIIEF